MRTKKEATKIYLISSTVGFCGFLAVSLLIGIQADILIFALVGTIIMSAITFFCVMKRMYKNKEGNKG